MFTVGRGGSEKRCRKGPRRSRSSWKVLVGLRVRSGDGSGKLVWVTKSGGLVQGMGLENWLGDKPWK